MSAERRAQIMAEVDSIENKKHRMIALSMIAEFPTTQLGECTNIGEVRAALSAIDYCREYVTERIEELEATEATA